MTRSRRTTTLESPDLLPIVLKALAGRSGAEAPDGVSAAAQFAYDDLVRVSVRMIGQVGIDAMTGRTLYLMQRAHPWLATTGGPGHWTGPFAQIASGLKEQPPAAAMEAAGVLFTTLAGVIAGLIGESLTLQILQEAWPDAFADLDGKEK